MSINVLMCILNASLADVISCCMLNAVKFEWMKFANSHFAEVSITQLS